MELLYTYHPAWLLLCAVIAFAVAFFLYRKDALLEDVKSALKWVMAIFRFVSVFIICLLLLGIILEKLIDRKEKPLIFIANDNSESIVANKDSAFYRNEFVPQLKELSNNLSEKFDVIEYNFSDEVYEGLGGEYDGKLTDISKLYDQIFDQYTNRNIGGVVMATDGMYNTGSNPIYTITRKSFLPIFAIGLGDTNDVKDVKVDYIKHNDIAFLGNDFPVNINIAQTKCQGEKVKVSVYQENKLLKEEVVDFTTLQSQKDFNFNFKATSIGYQKYTVTISELENEFSVKNNSANFYIEVIDGRQKIAIIPNGPHPDIAALRFVIENNKNYEVEIFEQDKVQGLAKYDLAIIHNYQGTNNNLSAAIESGKTPCLFLVGNETNFSGLSQAKVGFSGLSNDQEEVGFQHNPAFKEILLNPEIIQMLSSAPPLQAPFGSQKFSSAIDVLAYQKVGNITLDKPLIYFTKKNSSRFGVVMGEGIWRWRLHDQLKNSTTKNFEELVSKIITFLAIKENRDPFKVHIDNEFTESQNVKVKAELYNQSYELVNEPEVVFKFNKESENELSPHFVRVGNSYQLDLGKLQQGVYSWTASTDFQGKHYEKSGSFVVKEIKLELLSSKADHRLLKNMAKNSNGVFYLPSELKQLEKDINERDDLVTVVYQEKSFDDLIDYKWLFFLILAFLTGEWFFRKFNGAY
ncbi:MAG: hypothetical protein ABJG68_06145 [Crocinitomicaceae bacterium]